MSSDIPALEFQIHDDEVLPSYIIRFAHMSRLSVDSVVETLCQNRFHLPLSFSERRIATELAKISFADEAKLVSAQFARFSQSGLRQFENLLFPDELFKFGYRRIAPGEFSKDIEAGRTPYYRKHWILGHNLTDAESGELLLYTCPFCDQKLSWTLANYIERCDRCGGKLWLIKPQFPIGLEQEYEHLSRSLELSNGHTKTPSETNHDHPLSNGTDRLALVLALSKLIRRYACNSNVDDERLTMVQAMRYVAEGTNSVKTLLAKLAFKEIRAQSKFDKLIGISNLTVAISNVKNEAVLNYLNSILREVG